MQNRPFNKATSSSLQRNLNTGYFVLQTLSLHTLLTKAGREPPVSLESSKGRWKTRKGLKAELRQVPGSRGALTALRFTAVNQKNQSRAVFSMASKIIRTAQVPRVSVHPTHPTPFIFSLTSPANTSFPRWCFIAGVTASPVKAISLFSSHVLFFFYIYYFLYEDKKTQIQHLRSVSLWYFSCSEMCSVLLSVLSCTFLTVTEGWA